MIRKLQSKASANKNTSEDGRKNEFDKMLKIKQMSSALESEQISTINGAAQESQSALNSYRSNRDNSELRKPIYN